MTCPSRLLDTPDHFVIADGAVKDIPSNLARKSVIFQNLSVEIDGGTPYLWSGSPSIQASGTVSRGVRTEAAGNFSPVYTTKGPIRLRAAGGAVTVAMAEEVE